MENQNQEQTSFSQVPELHKRHFRSFWPIVIIAVVSALVGGILVFLLFNQGLDEQLNSLLPGSSYRQTRKEVKDQEINTSTWQTYRNEEYGFEFKYPKIYENHSSDGLVFQTNKGEITVRVTNNVLYDSKVKHSDFGLLENPQEVLLGNTKTYQYKISKNCQGYLTLLPYSRNGSKNSIEVSLDDCYAAGYHGSLDQTLPLYNQILSTFKFIDPEISGNRILLTPENRSQYNKFGNEEEIKTSCEIKFNFDLPNTSVIYTSQKWGFSFEVPFNNNWGNEKFKLNPYDVNSEGYVSYGPIGSFEGCGWSRDQSVTMLKKKTALEILAYLNRNGDYGQLTGLQKPEIVNINGLEVVKYEDNGLCYYPIMVVIGKNYNYEFRPLCGGNFKDVEARVKTVKLIE